MQAITIYVSSFPTYFLLPKLAFQRALLLLRWYSNVTVTIPLPFPNSY